MNKVEALLQKARETEIEHPLDALAAISGFDLHRGGMAAYITEAADMLGELNPRLSQEQAYFLADQIDGWWKTEPESAWTHLRDSLRQGTVAAFFRPEKLVHMEVCPSCHKPVSSAFKSGKQWLKLVHHDFCPECGCPLYDQQHRETGMVAASDLRKRIFAFILTVSALCGAFAIFGPPPVPHNIVGDVAGILFVTGLLGWIY